MANKKLVLSPEQTEQAIIYKVENGLKVTPEERARYDEIKSRPAVAPRSVAMYNTVNAGNKQAALNVGQKQMAYDNAAVQQSQAQAQAQYTVQMQKGRQAEAAKVAAGTEAANNAVKYNNKVEAGKQATQNAVNAYAQQQRDKLNPAPAQTESDYDVWLKEWKRHAKNYEFYKNTHPDMAQHEYTLMSNIAKQAQDAGVYAYVKKLTSIGDTSATLRYAPLFYATYDDYVSAVGDTRLDRASFEMHSGNSVPVSMASTPAADVYNADKFFSGDTDMSMFRLDQDPNAAALIVLSVLRDAGIAIEDFNNEYDTLRLPPDYDYSDGSKRTNKVLQAMSIEADDAEKLANTVTARVPVAFKNNGTQWQGAFLYCFYKSAPEYIGLSEDDIAYANAMVAKYSGYAQYLNTDYTKPSNKKALKKQASNVTSEVSNGTDEVLRGDNNG